MAFGTGGSSGTGGGTGGCGGPGSSRRGLSGMSALGGGTPGDSDAGTDHTEQQRSKRGRMETWIVLELCDLGSLQVRGVHPVVLLGRLCGICGSIFIASPVLAVSHREAGQDQEMPS